MYLTRNQAYGNPVPWVRIPPSPPGRPRKGFRIDAKSPRGPSLLGFFVGCVADGKSAIRQEALSDRFGSSRVRSTKGFPAGVDPGRLAAQPWRRAGDDRSIQRESACADACRASCPGRTLKTRRSSIPRGLGPVAYRPTDAATMRASTRKTAPTKPASIRISDQGALTTGELTGSKLFGRTCSSGIMFMAGIPRPGHRRRGNYKTNG
jgi:hypothetical protein